MNSVEFVDGREYPIKGWSFVFDDDTCKYNIDFFIDECDSFWYIIDDHILKRKGIGDDHFYEETEIRAFYINGIKYECKCELKPKAKCNHKVKNDVLEYAEYIGSGAYKAKAKYSTYKEYRNKPKVLIPEIEKVVFNPPATIIMWKDNTKTVVKCGEDEMYDCEKGMAMAIAKRALGNQGNYYDAFRKPCEDYWQKEFDEQFIEAVTYHLDGFKYIHPITLDYSIGWVLQYVYGCYELSKEEKERLVKLAWKEVPKAYSDWNTYVENNEDGAWREVDERLERRHRRAELAEAERLRELANDFNSVADQINEGIENIFPKNFIETIVNDEKENVKKAVVDKVNEMTRETLFTLENGYPPKYDTNPKKEDDEWIDVLPSDKQEETAPMNPEDYLGDNSYERWVKNTPLKDKIRARRKAMGLTAKEVADKMGISNSTYYNWEYGVSQGPRYREVREKLAEVLGFKMEELF